MKEIKATHEIWSHGKKLALKWSESSGRIQFEDGAWSRCVYTKERLGKINNFSFKQIRPMLMVNK